MQHINILVVIGVSLAQQNSRMNHDGKTISTSNKDAFTITLVNINLLFELWQILCNQLYDFNSLISKLQLFC